MKPIISLALALVLSVAVNLYQWRHVAAVEAAAAGQLDRAQDANGGALATIKALQDSNAECYAGRVFDRTAAAAAMVSRETSLRKLDASHAQASTKLAALLNDQCRDWAAQPACGVIP